MSVKATINEFDIDRCDLHNSKNWGTEDGVYYLIDYGISQYISTLYKKSEVELKQLNNTNNNNGTNINGNNGIKDINYPGYRVYSNE